MKQLQVLHLTSAESYFLQEVVGRMPELEFFSPVRIMMYQNYQSCKVHGSNPGYKYHVRPSKANLSKATI